MTATIRKATLNDKEIWVKLNSAFMEFEIEDDSFWNSPEDNDLGETFDKAIKESELIDLIIIENENGLVIGFANLMKTFSVWSKGKGLILDDLFISEEHQGKGYGKEVMLLLEEYAINGGYKRLQFQSEETNKGAYEFYTRLGYLSENMKFYIKHLKSSAN